MRAYLSISLSYLVLTVFVYAAYGQATSADPRDLETSTIVHFQLNDSCEFVTPAQAFKRQGYVALIPDGQSEEWYSPELGRADYLAVSNTKQGGLAKAIKNSGFSIRQDVLPLVPAATVNATQDHASCPNAQQAWSIANDLRKQRRTRFQDRPIEPGKGVIPPQPLEQKLPKVSDATRSALKPRVLEGAVLLSMLVGLDGTISDVKVVRPLDPALDVKAADAVRRWLFKPGRKFGLPVPVRMNIEVNFNLTK